MERTIVGIDIGTTKVCTLVAEVDDEGRLHIVGVGVSPARSGKRAAKRFRRSVTVSAG